VQYLLAGNSPHPLARRITEAPNADGPGVILKHYTPAQGKESTCHTVSHTVDRPQR